MCELGSFVQKFPLCTRELLIITFQYFNTTNLNTERVSRSDSERILKWQTSPFVLCTRPGGAIGCLPPERMLICCQWKRSAGYWRAVLSTRSLKLESLNMFGRGFKNYNGRSSCKTHVKDCHDTQFELRRRSFSLFCPNLCNYLPGELMFNWFITRFRYKIKGYYVKFFLTT